VARHRTVVTEKTGEKLKLVVENREESVFDAMAADGGVLALASGTGRLFAVRLSDGVDLWRRDLRGESVEELHFIGDQLMAIDPGCERVQVFDRADGRLRKRIFFQQPYGDEDLVRVVRTDDVDVGVTLNGPSHVVTAAALSSATEAPLWQAPLEKPIRQLFLPSEGTIGVSLMGGDVLLLDARTGEVTFRLPCPSPDHEAVLVVDGDVGQTRQWNQALCVAGASNGLTIDGVLILRYFDSATGSGNAALLAVDLSTGKPLWERGDLASGDEGGMPFRAMGDLLPALLLGAAAPGRPGRRLGLAMLDARTGFSVGQIAELQSGNPREPISGEFRFLPGVVAVGNGSLIQGFETVPASESDREGL
jgi:outer membrane protein assembly factor BamB